MSDGKTGLAFHLSLNVADLEKSVAFYRALFGIEPAKVRGDYAKFEPADPPLVLSMQRGPAEAGRLNHLGFRASASEQLVEAQRRLELAGYKTIREEGVECCYAKQTKFWARDPDGTMWEWYVFEGDIENRGDARIPKIAAAEAPKAPCCSGPGEIPVKFG